MARKSKPIERIGIAVFSYALRNGGEGEPGPCNRKIAHETMRAVRHLKYWNKIPIIGCQWEAALALPKRQEVALIVHEHRHYGGEYLDSEEVWAQFAEEFRRQGITKVLPVANPFLHLGKVKRLIRRDGFQIYRNFRVRRIGFDRKPDQWQTRSALKSIIYAIGQAPKVLLGNGK